MQITSIQIKNYKSFLDSGSIKFDPKFNVIVGENNAGKTALLEALSLKSENIPHLSNTSVPRRGGSTTGNSSVEVGIKLDKEELLDLLREKIPNFFVPTLKDNHRMEASDLFFNWLERDRTIICEISKGTVLDAEFPFDTRTIRTLRVSVAPFNMRNGEPEFEDRNMAKAPKELLPFQLAEILVQRVYAFRAERFFVGQCKFGNQKKLNPDASNLPEVLNSLQGSYAFDEFNRLVNQIYPKINRISVHPHETDNELIKIYVNTNRSRDDLALPLQDSGTGIGQVLAILYIILTASFPQTIIIDEPQSFLHPNAIRRLFDVLKRYPQHQYIISTHSPIVISASNPGLLFSITKEGDESVVEAIDRARRNQIEKVLRDIGARLSDVYGADNILWVEGATEEICFPLILTRISEIPLLDTVIVGVLHTGDFEGKDPSRIFKIYKKLSQSNALLPPPVGFIFDKEGKTQQQQEDLIRRSRTDNNDEQTTFFTSRRMYENYLLNPEAIAFVMSNIEGFTESSIEMDEIEQWIEENRWNKKYFDSIPPKTKEDKTLQIWLEEVHGARVLQDMFKHFSTGFEYDKKVNGFELTSWLVENSPKDLADIGNLLKNVIGRVQPI